MNAPPLDVRGSALVLLGYQNYNVHRDGYWAQASPGYAERVAPRSRARSASSTQRARQA